MSKKRQSDTLDEIRAQCASVRKGLLDGSMSYATGMGVVKVVVAEALMVQEVRKLTELHLKHAPSGDITRKLLGKL